MRTFHALPPTPTVSGSASYADDQWAADPMTPAPAAESVLDCFKRAVRAELELLHLECRETLRASRESV